MLRRLFNKKPKKARIQRLDKEPYEIDGEKLAGDTFQYEDGDGEANLYLIEDKKVAIELRLTDSKEHMHVLLRFETFNEAIRFMKWMHKDLRKTKLHIRSLLQ